MNKDIIKKTTEELLNKMTFEGEVFMDGLEEENILLVNIETHQPNFLIGQAGANLDALQHIVRILVGRKTDDDTHFLLDVNNYRRNRIDLLREMAKNIAEQALLKKVAVTLQPMPAYERRIIHLVLSDNSQISTESIGIEGERKVIVKPIL